MVEVWWLMLLVSSLLMGLVRPDPQVPCYFIFGDSLVDNGNNNYIASLARANYMPYGIDFPGGPSGRFSNGMTTVDVIGKTFLVSNYVAPKRLIIILYPWEYNATIEFYWAPFLVTSNCDNATSHKGLDRIVHEYSGSLERHAQHWKGVDILVFNTYAWWQPGKMMKIVRRSWGKKYIRWMKAEDGYRLVLKSMVSWLENNIDPQKTRVFFTTMSATHFRSAEWGGKRDGNCYGETTPILDPTYWGSGSSKSIMKVVGEVLGASKTPITIINVTQLSEYRKDAHVSIYRLQPYDLTQKRPAKSDGYADCNHWCLPGLQDTWNELLYAKLLFP
ncbi:protein trichome birefringence-like 33 [Elaeis guineensis]|uniref:protein trichome birefringence-like 33 n=1 Tax=Elaeis guineensis var. tenera TaxID=51953 RepID=UPI003C6D88E6